MLYLFICHSFNEFGLFHLYVPLLIITMLIFLAKNGGEFFLFLFELRLATVGKRNDNYCNIAHLFVASFVQMMHINVVVNNPLCSPIESFHKLFSFLFVIAFDKTQ